MFFHYAEAIVQKRTVVIPNKHKQKITCVNPDRKTQPAQILTNTPSKL